MMSIPGWTPSAAVYLFMVILLASAQCGIEILGLLGQLAVFDGDAQNIRDVLGNTLTFYGINFTGWSGLVR